MRCIALGALHAAGHVGERGRRIIRLDKAGALDGILPVAGADGIDRHIQAGGTLKFNLTVTLRLNMADQKLFNVHVYLPEGWTAQGRMHVHASMPVWTHDNVPYSLKNGHSTTEITLTAPETIAAQNHAVIELRVDGRPTPLLVPLTILG